jgi:proteic killer suppression protein
MIIEEKIAIKYFMPRIRGSGVRIVPGAPFYDFARHWRRLARKCSNEPPIAAQTPQPLDHLRDATGPAGRRCRRIDTERAEIRPYQWLIRACLTSVSESDTYNLVIRSFRDKSTEAVFNGESPKGFPADLVKVARRKLRYLNAAGDLGDLRSPPGNRLEALAGGRKGQHSIRINDQFRVCFVWTAEGPAEVEVVDYH